MSVAVFSGFTTYSTSTQDNTCDHTYTTVVINPTCTERGYTTHYCTTCGFEYTENFIQALGHTMVEVVTEPTCTAKGYITHSCTTCDYEYKDSYVDATGHDYNIVITHPTCENDGYTTYTCNDCSDSFVDNYVQANGHDYVSNTISATCTSYGYTEHTCNDCADRYVTDYIKPLGHTFESVVVAATSTTTGYTKHTCVVCDYSYISDYVDSGDDGYINIPTTPSEPDEPTTTPTPTPTPTEPDEEAHEHDYIFNAQLDEENKKILTHFACECGASGGTLTAVFTDMNGQEFEILPDINGDFDYSAMEGDFIVTIVDNWGMELTKFMLSVESENSHDFVLVTEVDSENKTLTLSSECGGCCDTTSGLKAIFTDEDGLSSTLMPNENGVVDYSKLEGKFEVTIVDSEDFLVATLTIETEESENPTPTVTPEPTDPPEEESGSSLAGILGILLLVIGIGGVVAYIIINKKNKENQGD